ncbi:MAG: hypothetical protein WC924_06100, partial [Candidatus Gracilibacteria bacterium]
MRPRLKNQPAYSLIFAFLVMTIIMFYSATTAQTVREAIASHRNLTEGAVEVKWAAFSAAQLGVVAMKDYNAGYSVDLTEDAFQLDEDGDGTYETWADYTVYSSAQTNDTAADGYFYTPIPGTGSAASGDDCSIQDDDLSVDHPCNWNKLLYGESVTIPLYTDDGFGGILTPSDFSSFNGWYLKVRTPCSDTDGQPDEADCSARFEFDGDGTDSITDTTDDDSSVVFWQLVGEDVLGNSVSLIPDDANTSAGYNIVRLPQNTEIYEDAINEASSSDYIVLPVTNTAPYTDIYQVCTAPNADYPNELSTLSLQLNIVTPLIDINDGSIPYLE